MTPTTRACGAYTLYVDDMMPAEGNGAVLNTLKYSLVSRLTTTDVGDTSLTLGMRVARNHGSRLHTISQADYIESVLEQHILQE